MLLSEKHAKSHVCVHRSVSARSHHEFVMLLTRDLRFQWWLSTADVVD